MLIPNELTKRYNKIKSRGDTEKVAALLNTSKSTVSNIIQGHQPTTFTKIQKIEAFIKKREAKMQLLSNPIQETE